MAKKKAAKKKVAKKKVAKSPAHKAKTEQSKREAARNKGEQEQFSWEYDDIAALTGKNRNAIYQAASRGAFDPHNFRSILYYLARHAKIDTKKQMLAYMLSPENNGNPGMKKKK